MQQKYDDLKLLISTQQLIKLNYCIKLTIKN